MPVTSSVFGQQGLEYKRLQVDKNVSISFVLKTVLDTIFKAAVLSVKTLLF